MKNILLINAEGVQTICLARSLRKHGHFVIGFCNARISSGYMTRWLNKKYICPDITLSRSSFKNFLFDFLSEHKIDLIIPLADDGAEFLSSFKSEIEKNFFVKCAVPIFEKFNIANNKQLLMQLCENNGICHPKTRELNENNLYEAALFVGFPALIKPNFSQGAKGIMKVGTINELKEKFKIVSQQFGSCTLQQYINQPGYYYNVMLYRDRNGNMDNYTIIKIRRFFPIKGGSSCYCETIEKPSLLDQCRKVLDKLNWIGFADFDVLEDSVTGELRIIEINPRIPSSFQAAFAAGIDFGEIILADEFNEELPHYTYQTGKQVRWMGLDVMWFLFSKERFNFKPSWFNFFGKNVSYHDGAWNDPFPMLAGMLAGVLKYLNSDFRKSKLKS